MSHLAEIGESWHKVLLAAKLPPPVARYKVLLGRSPWMCELRFSFLPCGTSKTLYHSRCKTNISSKTLYQISFKSKKSSSGGTTQIHAERGLTRGPETQPEESYNTGVAVSLRAKSCSRKKGRNHLLAHQSTVVLQGAYLFEPQFAFAVIQQAGVRRVSNSWSNSTRAGLEARQ